MIKISLKKAFKQVEEDIKNSPSWFKKIIKRNDELERIYKKKFKCNDINSL